MMSNIVDLPTISVIMSVYNGERYLRQAIDSILTQTYEDFEFIIINDGSTDSTVEILRSYTDPRLRIIEQENIGLTRSLNRGVALAKGKYIARMDADDLSMPERFARQVAFLDAHPEIGMVGTSGLIQNETRGVGWEYPVHILDEDIRHNLIKGNQFVHTSVMLRKVVLQSLGGYDETYPYIQDYELWVRLAALTRLANLPDVLVIHREHKDTVSALGGDGLDRIWTRMCIRYKSFRSLDYPIYYIFYILQPILFTMIEIYHKLYGAKGRDR